MAVVNAMNKMMSSIQELRLWFLQQINFIKISSLGTGPPENLKMVAISILKLDLQVG